MLRQVLVGLAALTVGSSLASASQILTPAGCGGVGGSLYQFPAAFDNQPTWDGTQPVGGNIDGPELMVGWDAGANVAYIDLGSNWASWRIEQVWTQYKQWRGGDPFPFTEVWWNDHTETTNTGVTETRINFDTQTHLSSGGWIQDFDNTASPVTPHGQYLMLGMPSSRQDQSTEFAFVGVVPEPTTLGLLGAVGAGMLIRRRHRA